MPAELPLRDDWETPAPDHLSPDHPQFDEIMAAHAASVEAGQLGYIDPASGLFVFNAQGLRTQPNCCSNRCRHCPYDWS